MSTSTQKNYMDLMDDFFFETSKLKSDEQRFIKIIFRNDSK